MRLLTVREHEIFPDEFPEPWASDWGEDEFGLFMGFTYKGARQMFRWIEPGTFMMGSPKDEPERFDREPLHEVTLTQGYWLADTPVTQALWKEVMRNNPSDFKGKLRPVDSVSWFDAQRFIDAVNQMKPELRLSLPTEAQWEYACRAGTTTPFSWGEQLTVERANFNTGFSQVNVQSGLYRAQTLDVDSLYCNEWGLKQMHGNVREWCEDRYGAYPPGAVFDPVGAGHGNNRVHRGGSWVDGAGYCRSACRGHWRPIQRNSGIGFRLARC